MQSFSSEHTSQLLSCDGYHTAGFAQLWNRQTFAATTSWFSENRRLLIPWYRRYSLTAFRVLLAAVFEN